MRVCIFSPASSQVSGGVEAAAVRLTSYLNAWGHDWVMLAGESKESNSVGERILTIRTPNAIFAKRLILGWRAAWRVPLSEFDIIHVHGAEYGWALGSVLSLRRLAARLGRKRFSEPRIIVTCHGVLKRSSRAVRGRVTGLRYLALLLAEPCLAFLEARILPHASCIVCVSKGISDDLQQMYGVPSAKLEVIPNAVDVRKDDKPNQRRRSNMILWVGNDSIGKDLPGALGIFQLVRERQPSSKLIVVGVSARDEKDGVTFLGRRSAEEIAGLYQESRVLLCSSPYEADPTVVKEAMSCGTPVIVSEPASTAVIHGVNGLVARGPSGSTEESDELVDFTEQLLIQDDLWRQLSEGALASSTRFTPPHEREAYARVYAQVMRKGTQESLIAQWYDSFYSSIGQAESGPWYEGAGRLLSELEPTGILDKVVLEVGCGNGGFISALNARTRLGIDPSREACRLTKKRGTNSIVAVGESLPIRSSTVDIAICCEVLEHVESPQRTILEINRALKPGGLVVVSSPNYLNVSWLALRLIGDLLRKPGWTVRQPIDRLTTYFSTRRLLRDNGFRVTKSLGCVLEPPGIYHWRRQRNLPTTKTSALAALALHPVIAARRI